MMCFAQFEFKREVISITDNTSTSIGTVSEKLICRISQLLDSEAVSAQGIKSLTSALKDLKDLREGGGEEDGYGVLILPEADPTEGMENSKEDREQNKEDGQGTECHGEECRNGDQASESAPLAVTAPDTQSKRRDKAE